MATVPDFYSVNEAKKPAADRRYHDNDKCGPGGQIKKEDRQNGQNGYSRCEDCIKLD